ncbi:MAG TPA: hypothetical protein VK039_04525, partial [Brevibacterium sp.]|nr:hypothetical protein [Brevibacterium sp.]
LERRSSTSGTVSELAGDQHRASGYSGPSVDLWEDFTVLPGTPGAVASALCGKRAVRVAGTYKQRMTAWSAGLDQVLVVELVRDLQPAGDRKMRPISPWRVDAQVQLGSSAAPRLRRGSVANDYGTSDDGDPVPSASGAEDPYAKDALFAIKLLPGRVQRGLSAAVPSAQRCMGRTYANTTNHVPYREHIHLLRHDSHTAVALYATRGFDAPTSRNAEDALRKVQAQPWDVTQVTFTPLTSSDIASLSGSPRLRIGADVSQ